MNLPGLDCGICILLIVLTIPFDCQSQEPIEKIRTYINAGYVDNLSYGCSDCDKRVGGSFRVGLLTKGKFGFFIGYTWYNVDLYRVADYEDKGSAFLGGIDFILLRRSVFQWYLQGGIAWDRYKSSYFYSNKTETENSFIPQLGFLLHISRINTYIGMGGDNFNVGLGLTF